MIVPDQIGFGRSSKPIIPYNFHDMARNTHTILQHLNITQCDGGGTLDGRDARREVCDAVSGHGRASGHLQPDRPHRSTVRPAMGKHGRRVQAHACRDLPVDPSSLMRYVTHNPAAWTPDSRVRAHSIFVDVRRGLAAVSRWCRRSSARSHTSTRSSTTGRTSQHRRWCSAAPRIAFRTGVQGAHGLRRCHDPGSEKPVLLLIPGLGHVPHMEAPEKFFPPLIAFLKE